MPKDRPTPENIMKLGHGFWGSKTLLAAVKLSVFEAVASGPKMRDEIEDEVGLHPRSSVDFLDALVALDVLDR